VIADVSLYSRQRTPSGGRDGDGPGGVAPGCRTEPRRV